MVDKNVFKERIVALLKELSTSQDENIDKASELFAECIKNDGVVHIFGTGHSIGMGIEMSGKLGNLIPIHMMRLTDFVTKGVITLKEFTDKDNDFERRSDLAQRFYELYDIRPQDVFMIISNSGINGLVIDLAIEAKRHGHKVVIVTSMKHTNAEASRHPSGKKLYMFGDVVIDNCGPHGDALLETGGIANVCSVSSICNNFISQSLTVKTVHRLATDGDDVPLITGDTVNDQKRFEHYRSRI